MDATGRLGFDDTMHFNSDRGEFADEYDMAKLADRLKQQIHLLDCTLAPTIIYTTSLCNERTRILWELCGVEVVNTKLVEREDNNQKQVAQVCLDDVLADLASRGVLQLLIEGGAAVHHAFIHAGFVDEIASFTGPKIIGGSGSSWISSPLAETISDAKEFSLIRLQQFENDVLCVYRPFAQTTESKHERCAFNTSAKS